MSTKAGAIQPAVDFIVGNPPFIGTKRMRAALGDGYVDALKASCPEVPDTSDFVMFWWDHAATLARTGAIRQFGLITTNSLRQVFNRKVIERHVTADPPLGLRYAIADHPWVDSANGAAVRIAMTVGCRGAGPGMLHEVLHETAQQDGEVEVQLGASSGTIMADLRIGAPVSSARPLASNSRMCWQGCKLVGAGFQVLPEQVDAFAANDQRSRSLLRAYWAGNDITRRRNERFVVDTFGLTEDDLRTSCPAAYQWLIQRVLPERKENRDRGFREKWWLFGRPRPDLRLACTGLSRYIVTSEVSKHRTFMMLSWPKDLIDGSVIAIASDDYLHLGLLSSSLHVAWALAAGGTLEDRPRYQIGPCFATFPFPDADTGLTQELAQRIRHLAEQIDAHRKTRQAQHPRLTLTGMYNVLELLRRGDPLDPVSQSINDSGLVAVLRSLHDDLDAAVLAAYGWTALTLPADTDELLVRLVELNAKRASEEAAGTVRWLRPDFQRGTVAGEQTEIKVEGGEAEATTAPAAAPAPVARRPWPSGLPEQIKAVADVLGSAGQPLALDAIAANFTARGRWRERLPTILETLEALGRARRVKGERWDARLS